ncbi:MAG TPA: flavin reductase family protein [Planctomycetota bacterium]|nr:flavin reductase family protein [Planctomycetota bacterium]
MRVAVPLRHSYRLLNHGPTTLIASAAGGRRNVMAAAWVMPLDFEPPKLAAVIAGETFTRELVAASGEMVVSVPTVAQVDLVHAVGSSTGRDADKFETFGIGTEPASLVAAPLVVGCAAWLECRIVDEPDLAERYDLFVAEVLAAWADDRWFHAGGWDFADPLARSLHHVAGGSFFATGERVDATTRKRPR